MDNLCERCNYDEADQDVSVAEMFQDRYQAICAHCAKALNKLQARREGE
jgi:hypothetical protein